MTLNLIPFIQLREFDNNGKLLDGGKIYFYQAGTNVPQDTFQNAQGTINNTNPVILDSAGSAKIFLLPSLYHVQIYDKNNVLIHDIDNVGTAGSSVSGAGTFIILDTYNDLRNLTADYDLVYVQGRDTVYDGGQGLFQLNTNSTNSDDDGIELVRLTTSHYTRQFADYIDPRWYGVLYNTSIDNTTKLLTAFDASITYKVPVLISDNTAIGTNLTIKSGAKLRLDGGKLYGLGATDITIRFKEGSKLISGSSSCFGSVTQPIFEKSVCPTLSLSWFTNNYTQVINSTSENYKLDIDVTLTVSTNIAIPTNFEVDFIGGSYINVNSVIDIQISNLVYKGVGQIIKYNDKSYIGAVQVGNSFCYLEWFGGLASTSTDTDNSIPFLAALKHGYIYLISNSNEFYSINTSGTYTTSGNVSIQGNYIPNNNVQSDKVPSTLFIGSSVTINVSDLVLTGIKIFGTGALNAHTTIITNTIIAQSIDTNTGITSTLNDVTFFSGNYVAVGASGKIVYSTDGKTWTNSNLITSETINTISRTTKYFIAAGTNGKLWTSINGIDWTLRTTGTTNTIQKIKWLNNRLVATCTSGLVLYSIDGIAWNSSQTSSTDIFRSVTYFNSLYIVVGNAGNIFTSPDLLTWTKITVTGISTTILYDIDTNGTIATIVGQNGNILTSTNGTTWRNRIGATSTNLVCVKYFTVPKLWIAMGSNQILTSTDSIVWKNVVLPNGFSQVIYNVTLNGGTYIFVCGNGVILKTFDLNFFEIGTSLNTYNLYDITNSETKFISVADDGNIVESKDSINWTNQSIGNSIRLVRVKQIGNIFFALGDSGTYFFSYDATNWTKKTITTGSTLKDITANSDYTLFTIIGSTGKIFTSPDLTITTPIVTERVSNVSQDLVSIVYDSDALYSKYLVVGNSGTILYSTDSITWTVNNYTSNGFLTTSAGLNIIFGDAGLILTSTDLKNWTKRTSNTTNSLTCGVISSTGLIVIGGVNGTIITSTDGITWTVRTSGVAVTFNAIIANGSQYVIAGASGILRKSTDGINWSSAYGIATAVDFNSIKFNNGLYMIVGSSGFCSTSPDLTTWSTRTTNTTTILRDSAYGNGYYSIVGDNGIALYSTDVSNWVGASSTTTNDLYAVTYKNGFVAVGELGTIVISPNCRFWNSVTSVKTTNDLTDVMINGSDLISVGNNFTVIRSSDNNIWTTSFEKPTSDIKSLIFDSISNFYTATTYGKIYNSYDGLVWAIQDITFTGFNKVDRVNGKYILFSTVVNPFVTSTVYESISGTDWTKLDWKPDTYNALTYGVINGNGTYVFAMTSGDINSFTSTTGIQINLTKLSVYDSIIGSKINNTLPGTIANVDAVSISYIGLTTDSSFTNFQGILTDTVSRTNLTTTNSINVSGNITIVDSEIKQQSKGFDIFQIDSSVTTLILNNNTIRTNNSALVYSENESLKININGGILTNGNNVGLSNGFAKIYLNNVFDENGDLVENITAYSINGKTLSDTESFGSVINLTNSTSNWYHSQMASITSNTSAFTLSSDILLASDITNANTLRYRFGIDTLRFMKNFGGRIKFEIDLPTGYDKVKQAEIKLNASLYIPSYSVTVLWYSAYQGSGFNNDEYKVGKCQSVGSIKDGAKVINYSNIWSGRANMIAGDHSSDSGYNRNEHVFFEDCYCDRSIEIPTLSGPNGYYSEYIFGKDYSQFGRPSIVGNESFEAYITINSTDKNVVLPAGTSIKVELIPELPKTIDVLKTFYNIPENELDTLMGIEKVYLNFKDNTTKTIKLELVKVDGSQTIQEQKYLSVVDSTGGTNGTGTGIHYYNPKSYQWTVGNMRFLQQFEPEKLIDTTSLNNWKNIEIKIINLTPKPNYAQIFGVGSTAAGNADLVGNGRYNSAGNTHTEVTPIQFLMLTDGHYKHSTDTNYRILSRIEMVQYYQAAQ